MAFLLIWVLTTMVLRRSKSKNHIFPKSQTFSLIKVFPPKFVFIYIKKFHKNQIILKKSKLPEIGTISGNFQSPH